METQNLSGVIGDEAKASLNLTCGHFAMETDAQEWLVGFLRSCRDQDGQPFFKYVEEFRPGVPLFRHHRQSIDKDGYKCDVLALPKSKKFSAIFGAMVFEIKKSDQPIGPGLNQLKDYMASVFDVAGVQVVPSFGFLFPCRKQKAATASWMAHQSIGSICQEEYNQRIKVFSGEERLLEFEPDGQLVFSTQRPKAGRGSGSR
jgi:hypothetical protein